MIKGKDGVFNIKQIKKFVPIFTVLFSYGLLVFYSTGIEANAEHIQNLSASSGSEFVRLSWDETQETVLDYRIQYREKKVQLTGSIDPDGDDTVEGVSTAFASEVQSGNAIHVSGETKYVRTVNSDTLLTVWGSFSDLPIDIAPELTPGWTLFDDGVSLETETVVTGLENDKEYEFLVQAELKPSTSGKNIGKQRFSAGKVISETPYFEGYDIIILAGQSNMVGAALFADMELASENWRIKQWGRHEGFNNQVIEAGDPLHHASPLVSNSLGMTFARQYRDNDLSDNRELLLIPVAYGGTGFYSEDYPNLTWMPGDELSSDVVARANLAYGQNSNNEFVALLWHQGEHEIAYINRGDTSQGVIDQQWYETNWLAMMDYFDENIANFDSSTPTVVGRVNENWAMSTGGLEIDAAHQNIPNLRSNTVLADSINPTALTIWDTVHFDEASVIELGIRYYNAFKLLQ